VSELQAFLFCDAVVRDAATGKCHVQGVFDRVFSRAFPAIHQRSAIYCRLRGLEANKPANLAMTLKSPSGIVQNMPQLALNASDTGAIETTINHEKFPLPKEGRYTYELFVNSKKVGIYELLAVCTEKPETPNAKKH